MKSIRDNYVGPILPTKPCTFAIVGEAPGEEEALHGKPFIGKSGRMLRYTCAEIGFDMDAALITNLFRHKPPQTAKKPNDASVYFMKRTEAKRLKKETGWESPYPVKGTDGFLRPEREAELEALYAEIEEHQPDIVIALGAFPLWALIGEDKIGTYRGTIIEAILPSGYQVKVIGTYHPANILRNWSNRFHFFNDLVKAKAEIGSKTVKRTSRAIWTAPTLEDLKKFRAWFIDAPQSPPLLAVDIETSGRLKQITCVGIAPNENVAIVIPFVDETQSDGSYWPSAAYETEAWGFIADLLMDRRYPKVFQNGTYDMFWFMWQMGIPTYGRVEDTMHAHHAMEPELPKSLDALASTYINEVPWKTYVNFKENKKDA